MHNIQSKIELETAKSSNSNLSWTQECTKSIKIIKKILKFIDIIFQGHLILDDVHRSSNQSLMQMIPSSTQPMPKELSYYSTPQKPRIYIKKKNIKTHNQHCSMYKYLFAFPLASEVVGRS